MEGKKYGYKSGMNWRKSDDGMMTRGVGTVVKAMQKGAGGIGSVVSGIAKAKQSAERGLQNLGARWAADTKRKQKLIDQGKMRVDG